MNVEAISEAINSAAQEVSTQEAPTIKLLGNTLQEKLGIKDVSDSPAIYGLIYKEVPSSNEEDREEYGYFKPMFEFPEGVFPKRLASTTPDEYGVWKELAAVVEEPYSRARYADLLVERLPNGDERFAYAKLAIGSYREFSASTWPSSLDRMDALVRAHELAKTFKNTELTSTVRQEMLDMARTNLDSEDASPGVGMSLLELVAEYGTDNKEEILRLNNIGIEKFSDNAYAIESAHHVQVLLTPPEERPDLYRTQAEYFLEEAMKLPDGFQKMNELHRVEAFAQLHNLRDIEHTAIREVESLPQDSMVMQEHAYTIEAPQERLNEFSGSVTGDDNLGSALLRFGSTKAIDSYEDNLEHARAQMDEFVFLRLFTSLNIGEANSIINSTSTEDEKLKNSISESEKLQIMEFSLYAMAAMQAVVEKYDVDVESIADALTSEFINEDEAKALARGFQHYFNGDSDSTVKSLAPMAERIIRTAARAIGIQTTKLPNARRRQPGGVRGLGEILSTMEGFVENENTRRYWINALVDVNGYNLRNRVGHGLTVEFAKPDAVIMIHVICTLLKINITR